MTEERAEEIAEEEAECSGKQGTAGTAEKRVSAGNEGTAHPFG